VFFLLLAAIFFSSCTNRNLSPKDTLTTVISTPITNLNPLYGTDAGSQHINELLHAGLVTLGDNLVPKPYLAEEALSPDPLTMEFKLRKGCTFASGREITADDVKKSLDYFQDPANQSVFQETFSAIKRFEKIDPWRFRLVTDKPAPGLRSDIELLKIMDLQGVQPGTKPENIPGAGPYRLASLSAGEILLERRPQPCLPEPPMKKIRIKVVRDDLSRYLKLKAGEVDLVLNEMNYRKVEAIENDPSLPMRVTKGDGIGYSYIGLNLGNEKLKDPRVRRALALSLDIPSLIKYKSRGMAKPARNILADENFYANLSVPILRRDLTEAKRLLDEAGYSNGTNGKPPLRLTLKTNTSTISVENARVIVAQAKEAGIELRHEAHDWGIFYNDVKTGNTELYILRWVGVTDPRIYYEAFHSSEIGKTNRSRYRNPQLDHWLELGESTTDPEKRRQAYLKAQEIVAKDLPYIGLWYGANVAVYRKELKNVSLHPAGKWLSLLTVSKE
jgi:peptide/nickel transport system substrate-binding protein